MKDAFLKIWVAITAFLVAAVPIGMAATPGGASVTSSTDLGEYPSGTPSSISVEAGNITQAIISAQQSTYHWTGIYGNATGTLVLGDASSNKMYTWTATASYVFFDDDSTINWGTIDNATCTDVGTSFSFVADSTGASDSCSNTFNETGATNFKSIGNVLNTVYAMTYDNTGARVWITYAVKDTTANDVFFAAKTDNTPGTAYDGTAANYQAILPENGENGDTTATPYYIWIELF